MPVVNDAGWQRPFLFALCGVGERPFLPVVNDVGRGVTFRFLRRRTMTQTGRSASQRPHAAVHFGVQSSLWAITAGSYLIRYLA
jgi:hypothetical protein